MATENPESTGTEAKAGAPDSKNTLMAYGSIIIGIIGLCVYFKPVAEIFFGVTGMILSIAAKDKNATWFTDAVRSTGNYVAWLNIIWVCIEISLKFVGINLFN